MTVTYAFTGHRPKDLGMKRGGDLRALDERLVRFAKGVIHNTLLPDAEIISGLAEGWDMAIAEAAVDCGLRLIVAVPFEGQERYWSSYSQGRYRRLRAQAHDEHVIGPFPDTRFYKKRNEWMVDNGDCLGALWSGKTTGGTWHAVDYAHRWCVPVIQLWKAWIGFH